MADLEPTFDNSVADDMDIGDAAGETEPTTGGNVDMELADIQPDVAPRETFLDYLKSPIVELVIGKDGNQTTLSAHQALLVKAPYFAAECAKFSESDPRRVIELLDEDLDTVGSFLEYLYNGEYFPKRVGDGKGSALEPDSSIPSPDNTGAALLRHARLYALAEKFGIPALKSLAHTKIHQTKSTAKGEIAYARFVYKETTVEDTTLRRPIAAFWAKGSHVLRHEAENEFRQMCLEFPQFSFDVLSLMLDQKEKREPVVQSTPGSSRKRMRAI